jgi:hypothetical protein
MARLVAPTRPRKQIRDLLLGAMILDPPACPHYCQILLHRFGPHLLQGHSERRSGAVEFGLQACALCPGVLQRCLCLQRLKDFGTELAVGGIDIGIDAKLGSAPLQPRASVPDVTSACVL